MSKQDVNILSPVYTDGPRPHYQAITARHEENAKVSIYKTPDRVIPVIFLPGVMGSNLQDNKTKAQVWTVDSIYSVAGWINKGPEARKILLNPGDTEVNSGGKVVQESTLERTMFHSRFSRGWGEVGAMSYGTFLPWLQAALNDHQELINHRTEGKGKKTPREQLIAGITDSAVEGVRLMTDEVGLSYKYLFPVHAVGYNWLQSNKDSAQRLKEQVEKIVLNYKAAGLGCEKVILVTHSMGGLVARYYSEILGGRDRILGIVHGVMPDLGAPMAYKRMKTGEAGSAGMVIGANGAEMTAVLAQSPGPLQLLPGTHYGSGWLKVEGMQQGLPKAADPYSDIYLERSAWWGLCEERFINPENKAMDKRMLDNDWKDYDLLVQSKVKPVIEELHGHYHSCTYAFYGSDESKYPSYATLHWKDTSYKIFRGPESQPAVEKGMIFYPPQHYNQTVRYAAFVPPEGKTVVKEFTLLPPQDAGDGTVPVRAAVIPARCVQAQTGLSVDHEGAYKEQDNGGIDSYWFTLWSIVKIAQEIKKTGLAYAE